MPFEAVYQGKTVYPAEVDFETEVTCPDCGEPMKRRAFQADVTTHFWHHTHAGGGEGGGGGHSCGGESDTHKKWKSLACDKLRDIFGGEAKYIREEDRLEANETGKAWRQGDIVLFFDEPDEQLGRGIVAEVQHRNESKDLRGTVEDYAEQGFATVWLREPDFATSFCRLEEPDFRRRAFEAGWPDVVPEVDAWTPPSRAVHEPLAAQRRAIRTGKATQGAPATLPGEWCDDVAQQIWEQQDWNVLFRDTGPQSDGYLATQCIRGVRYDLHDRERLRIRLVPEVIDEVARRIKEAQEWGQYTGFSPTYLRDVRRQQEHSRQEAVRTELPLVDWIRDAPTTNPIKYDLQTRHEAAQKRSEERLRAECPHCGRLELHRPRADGESKRSTTCGSCSEWYLVFD